MDNLADDERENVESSQERGSLPQELAQLADVYINEAPSASRDARASTVEVVPLMPVVAVGPALAAELQDIAEQPEKPRHLKEAARRHGHAKGWLTRPSASYA